MILPLLQLDLFEISVYYDEILPNTKLEGAYLTRLEHYTR